ncbi:ciliogenesis-associated TTC17-interacting protein [Anoplolepis gracilipes]|uniref:ciliogenesis-associated TTC17-interacting protein n=1 Tax=Anoplolepis gracilipes TaxID=354296 RepID=UPI003B9EBD67
MTLCFKEALIITLKDESMNDMKQIGRYYIQVEPIGSQDREFLVHMRSLITIDGCLNETRLISSMMDNLQCLEEKYTEYSLCLQFLYEKNGLHEKSLFVGLEEDIYHVEITRTCPCCLLTLTETKDLKSCQYESLINEGANILLMRYLAITNFEGTLRFQNITINGNITINDYICTALQSMELHDNHQQIYTIERRIYTKDSLIKRIKIYLTSRGRILVYDWLNTPYIAQKSPLMQNDANQSINVQISFSSNKEWWMQNIEMLSKYLDMKSYNIAQYTEYLMDHPEIKQLIADYIQSLLIVKPVDVLDFTIQHFKAFARELRV